MATAVAPRHHRPMARESSTRAVIAAFLGNVALAALKATAAVMTGSTAMLAETFHSVADTGNQALLFLGLRLAQRPPDDVHPFGHGRSVYFWAFIVSALLFSVGGGFAIWEAVRSFLHPVARESFLWAYGVLAGAAFFESMSFSVAFRALRREKGRQPLRDYLRDVRDPTLLTVVAEDSAALVSIAVAAAGLGLTQATGSPLWDAAASAVIGVILVSVAVFLAIDNYSLLIGETAPDGVKQRIRTIVSREPAVTGLIALHTIHIGPESLFVGLDVAFRRELSTPDIETAIEGLKVDIQNTLRTTRPCLILIEPARGTA